MRPKRDCTDQSRRSRGGDAFWVEELKAHAVQRASKSHSAAHSQGAAKIVELKDVPSIVSPARRVHW
jgi:hypothetical protein